MGDRSNINFITYNADTKEYQGVNIYRHWGGVEDQMLALAFLSKARHNDHSYGAAYVMSNLMASTMDGLGCGVESIPKTKVAKRAFAHVQDNEHCVLNIVWPGFGTDQDCAKIVYFNDYTGKVVAEAPLTVDGISTMLSVLYKEWCDYHIDGYYPFGIQTSTFDQNYMDHIIKEHQVYVVKQLSKELRPQP